MDMLEHARYGLKLRVDMFGLQSDDEVQLFSDLERHANGWIQQCAPIQLIEQTLQHKLIAGCGARYARLSYKFVFYKWSLSPRDKLLQHESDVYVDLLYLQAVEYVRDVRRQGDNPLSNEKLAMLAVLEAFKSHHGKHLRIADLDVTEMAEFLPEWSRDNLSVTAWEALYLCSAKKLVKFGQEHFSSSMDYERQYLSVAQTHHFYGMSYFAVRLSLPRKWVKLDELLVGCNWHYVVICDVSF